MLRLRRGNAPIGPLIRICAVVLVRLMCSVCWIRFRLTVYFLRINCAVPNVESLFVLVVLLKIDFDLLMCTARVNEKSS